VKRKEWGRDKGGCLLKRQFVVGPTGVFGEPHTGLRRSAKSIERAKKEKEEWETKNKV